MLSKINSMFMKLEKESLFAIAIQSIMEGVVLVPRK